MDLEEIEQLIETAIPDASVEVTTSRHEEDEDHVSATVIAPIFADESLVDRHQRVHDALADHLIDDIHAIEIRTFTPGEYRDDQA